MEAGGGKGQHERLDVDDDRLFPSLESVSNFASTSQPPAATGAVASAVKTEEDSRAEWKARIRQQRDKAAHVQTQEEGDAKPKSYQHPSSQPPPRAFQQPQQQQHRQSMRGGIRAPEMQGKKTHNDSDYRFLSTFLSLSRALSLFSLSYTRHARVLANVSVSVRLDFGCHAGQDLRKATSCAND